MLGGKNMSREDFLKSIQVDKEVIDRINQVSLENGQTADDGQWTKGAQEQELAQTTGFDRDGDDSSPKDSIDIKKDMEPELSEELEELPALQEELEELPELQEDMDEMPELQEDLDELPELQEDLDELPELDESLDEQPGGEEPDSGMDNDMDNGMDGGMAM